MTELPVGYGAFVLDGKSATGKERDAGYRDASSTIIRWCDILVIVIERARLDSETGYGLKEALAWNVPIILIDPGEPDRFRLVLDGAELPDGADIDAALDTAVSRILGPGPRDDPSHGKPLNDYLAERITCDVASATDFEYRGPYTAHTVAPGWIAWGAAVNRNLRSLFKGLLLKKSGGDATPADARTLPFDRATAARFVDSALHFNRADALAGLYGDLHRGVQFIAVVVGIVAALVALVHALDEELPAAIFTLIEFSCLLFMFAAVKTSHRQRWLHRWIDYRLLAEIMRHAKFLALTGRPNPFSDLRSPLARADAPKRHWVETHVRAVLRAQDIAIPGRGGASQTDSMPSVRRYIVDRLILDQLDYHHSTASYERSLDTLLRRTVDILTPATIALIGLKFLAEAFSFAPWLHEGLRIPLVLLPAFTSGIIAMRAANQYAVTARRSDGMVMAMKLHRDAIMASASFIELGNRSSVVSRTLLSEVEGWTDVFSDRHIEIEV